MRPTKTILILSALVLVSASYSNDLRAQGMGGTDVDHVLSVVDEYREARERQIVDDFVDLLSLPNVATNLDDMAVNAAHIVSLLEPRGFKTRVLEAGNAPYVFGELTTPGAAETVLIYAHFDGQPVQEENWAHPPFEPTLLDDTLQSGGQVIDLDEFNGDFDPEWRLYARSAGDDKMPIVALMYALDALRANNIPLSVNLKVLFDGEEERGSPTVGPLIDRYGEIMDSDLLLFCDGPMHQSRQKQLVFGVRGSTTLDITTYGATRPLHSGHYGNWAPNPVMQMSFLLTSMRDESGRILVENYYDDVTPLTELERAAIAAMPDISELLKDELAIHTPEGDGVRIEELITQPVINARGIVAGGVGAKGRNIILSNATSSLNLRLVPAQTPERVRELIEAHVRQQGFHIVYEDPDAEILRTHPKVAKLEWRGAGYPALRTALDDPAALRMTGLMRRIAPDLILTPTMGGSLPLHEFGSRLTAPIIILPLANHDNNQHAENENIRLQNVWDAISVYAAVLATYGDT